MRNNRTADLSDLAASKNHRKVFTVAGMAGVLVALLLWVVQPVFSAESDWIVVGEVSALGGKAKVVRAFATDDNITEIGTKIYVGDVIETGADGSIELILGLNRRLRLAGNSAVKIVSIREKKKQKKSVEIKREILVVSFRKGEVRVRVRKNIVTPTPVLLRIGNMQALLERSDMICRRTQSGADRLEVCEFALAWGEVQMNLKVLGEKEWKPELMENVVAPGEGTAPVEPVASDKVKWQKITAEQAKKQVQELPFSIDRFESAPGDVPVKRDLLPGA